MSEFSPGRFKSLSTKCPEKEKPTEGQPEQIHAGAEEATSIFACPQDGCVKVFQRLSSLEKHLLLERCTRSLEKQTLLDLAKLGYKSRLEEGEPAFLSLLPLQSQRRLQLTSAYVKGWALKCSNKAYCYNAQQKAYLDVKFAIGQTTGKKLNGDAVALGPDGVCLFRVSEFLTPQQISAYFSRRAAKIHQQPSNEADIRASEEEDNFAQARETVMGISLQHPITFDQYDIWDMAKGGSLERLKLSMLQSICQKLELEVSSKPIRRKKSIWT